MCAKNMCCMLSPLVAHSSASAQQRPFGQCDHGARGFPKFHSANRRSDLGNRDGISLSTALPRGLLTAECAMRHTAFRDHAAVRAHGAIGDGAAGRSAVERGAVERAVLSSTVSHSALPTRPSGVSVWIGRAGAVNAGGARLRAC